MNDNPLELEDQEDRDESIGDIPDNPAYEPSDCVTEPRYTRWLADWERPLEPPEPMDPQEFVLHYRHAMAMGKVPESLIASGFVSLPARLYDDLGRMTSAFDSVAKGWETAQHATEMLTKTQTRMQPISLAAMAFHIIPTRPNILMLWHYTWWGPVACASAKTEAQECQAPGEESYP